VTAADTVERVFREERGRILATLIRACGDFDLAEEAVQEAFTVAIERWPRDGLPANPGAWHHHSGAAEGDRPVAAGSDVCAKAAASGDGCSAQRTGSGWENYRND
jgi:hypothetical protein